MLSGGASGTAPDTERTQGIFLDMSESRFLEFSKNYLNVLRLWDVAMGLNKQLSSSLPQSYHL